MIDEKIIEKAVKLLLSAAPESKVILFGSHARKEAGEGSDLDFLVVEPDVSDSMGEMVRLTKVLTPHRIPVDVLVVSAKRYDYWKDTPNTVFYRATREGRVCW